ncbi:MAG TPA: cell envelope integrity protein TolA [Anaeromyxobacter sp.]|nr:cell envelope integrity protein TolA [Anaeromyxobacter sp.]
MKFSCERCGKKYATAENPAPGRVYKLKCKACGHLIVVKASSGSGPALEAPAGSSAASSEPPSSPVNLEVSWPEPSRGRGNAGLALDSTTEVSAASMRGPHALETTPPHGDAGYVDLFSDVPSVPDVPPKRPDDPFLAAARASLPETHRGAPPLADMFADLRDDISATSAPDPPPRHSPPPVPKVPVIPKPKQVKSALPLVLIGAGVAVLVGILAFVMLSSGKKAPGPAHAPPVVATPVPVTTPPPPAPPPPQAAPTPPPETTEAAPEKPKTDARAEQRRREREEAQARAEQARAEREAREREAKARERAAREEKEREARAAREARDREARAAREERDREARAARERERAEREAAAKAERDAKLARERAAREERERAAAEARERERVARQQAAADKAAQEPEGGLTQGQIEGVLRSTKTAFDGCIQAARGSDVKLDGRRVMLRLNIQTSGAVTYPTLDDVTLNGTELGSCLKSAARLMVFPKFKGDTMHVEVPLVMR